MVAYLFEISLVSLDLLYLICCKILYKGIEKDGPPIALGIIGLGAKSFSSSFSFLGATGCFFIFSTLKVIWLLNLVYVFLIETNNKKHYTKETGEFSIVCLLYVGVVE